MLALSPSLFSTFGWPSEDLPISHEQNSFYRETEASDQSFLHSPPDLSQPLAGLGEFKPSSELGGDATMAKKLNHNASERDRRKRINSLYSSLRSLLPATDQTKKLSIPTMISRVLKYIPELQRELERLLHKKEELMQSRINSRQEEDLLAQDHDLDLDLEKKRKCAIQSSLFSAVSASPLGEREVVVQICTVKVNKSLLSEILLNLEEEDGLLLLNASCLESFGESVFYNLHLQVQNQKLSNKNNHEQTLEVQGTQRVEFEMLSKKLLSLYENREEELFPSIFGPRDN